MNEEEAEWIEDLKRASDDELEYTNVAYRQTPSTIDTESVPFGKKRHFWLNAIYDAYDIMAEIFYNQNNP